MCMHPAVAGLRCFSQALEVQPVIPGGEKAGCAVVAALDDMQRVTREV